MDSMALMERLGFDVPEILRRAEEEVPIEFDGHRVAAKGRRERPRPALRIPAASTSPDPHGLGSMSRDDSFIFGATRYSRRWGSDKLNG